ncbi:hypothetical protein ACEWPM_001765 [Roseovarius sp. S4756]|uniref:hypothetical protein n=1 Tax=Roseovarius maritimus TaxID=3342637 RepID=UPI00372CE5D6
MRYLRLNITSLAGAAVLLAHAPAMAHAISSDWSSRKCSLYRAALADALAARDTKGLRPEFLAANEAFIASGCREVPDLCAEGPEEIAMIDMLTVMTMNEGMASTFVPFACTRP